MELTDIKALIESSLGIVTEVIENAYPPTLFVPSGSIHAICQLLHESEKTYFDSLSCITGLDNGPEAGTMEVIYNLYSIPYNLSLMLKVEIPRDNPTVDSISDIWKSANWLERETYDLLGISFHNHPDLRRILLPKNWEGHPLRKDYQTQEYYHGITVDYDRDDAAPVDVTDKDPQG